MKQVLYGVGKSMLIDLEDDNKLLGLGDLQDVTINSSAEEEEIHGGDTSFPIVTFPKSRSITISAQNATFDISMLNVAQGAVLTKGVTEVYEYFDFVIDKNALVYEPKKLDGQKDYEIVENSFVVEGFTKGSGSATTGKYVATADTLTFAKEDAGKTVKGYYKRKTKDTATTASVYADKFPKTFKFSHSVKVFDDNSQAIGILHIIVFKAKSDNNFEFNLKPETAYAPKLSLKALNPNRPDKKLWDYVFEPIVKE